MGHLDMEQKQGKTQKDKREESPGKKHRQRVMIEIIKKKWLKDVKTGKEESVKKLQTE